MRVMLLQADARHLPLADRSVQCVVTSPPYWGLRDYGIAGQLGLESTPDAYVQQMVAVFREVRRVLKDDGICWLNLGDSYAAHPGQRKTTDKAGPKQMTNRGAPGAPSRHVDDLKAKDLVGIPWRVAFALQADGWYLRSDVIWSKPNPMPESVTDRPTKAHEYLFLLAKSQTYYYDADAVREPLYRPELLGQKRQMGTPRKGEHVLLEHNRIVRENRYANPAGRNRRSVWHIATQPYPGAHFATMPEALIEPCILAGSRNGDVVFDPFVGSGTVARVAVRLGRKGVGCDLNPKYLQLARERTHGITYGLPLETDGEVA